MQLIGLCIVTLGLIVASATAQDTTTDATVTRRFNRPLDDSNRFNHSTPMAFTNATMNITSPKSEMNITRPTSSSATMATTNQTGKTTEGSKIPITPTSVAPPKTTSTTKKGKEKPKDESQSSSDTTGVIIIIIIIIVSLGCAVACYIVRKRGRRYSVDFVSRQDEANIPLSIIDPELPGADTVPQNGLQTFENTETTAKAPKEAETAPKEDEDEKSKSEAAAEADKSAVDPGAESAAASPRDSEDKPKEDVAESTSPSPAPVQPSPEEKTDDEATVSNKTSVESLKETNENNSNNSALRQTTDLDSSNIFWLVPLDSPV